MKHVSDPYFVTMGKILIEMKLRTELDSMGKFYFEHVLKNDKALEITARDYEQKVSKSDNIVVREQYEMIKMMTNGRLGRE
jgi:hypothetical protein